ncbi:hypothetical protein [Arthrobacter sp. CJ23]|uniref:hypothetical protein n=1 Tax=Arthrobacter sp. CJ23 TaxID=2972479 RepID=UPI00215D2270|nr:hypothetical protein [Arthrobacter sp. CJ23]UVJ41267.1 hypothetical protein NVV90_09055 [Arthrobacter sp. CJ23]
MHGKKGVHQPRHQRQEREDLEEHKSIQACALGQATQHQDHRVGHGQPDDAGQTASAAPAFQ